MQETVRIFSQVIDQELGHSLSSQAKSAFAKALRFAFSFMGTSQSAPASGRSVLSADELATIRTTYDSYIMGNVELAETCMKK